MTADGSARVVTPQELLDARDRAWRRNLGAVSLVAEVLDDIPLEHREQALEVLGRVSGREPGSDRRAWLLRRWPAVHVVTTTAVAAEYYEKGTFWPKLATMIGRSNDQILHKEWGDAFLRSLERLGLATFAEADANAGTKYVGRILLHAGMPTYCLGDFYRILSSKRHSVPGLTPDEFVSWAASRAASSGIVDVDMPVQRFLRHGGEYAVDVADRVFDLLDTVASGGDTTDVPLPQRFREAAARFHEDGGDLVAAGGARGARKGDPRPSFVLSPFGRGVLLRLPPVGEAPDGRAVWSVSFDGETREVGTEKYVPGSDEPAPQTDVVVPKPVRLTSVSLAGHEDLALSLTLVDGDEALLAFDDDETLIPAAMPLPAGVVWLLYPGDVDALAVDGEWQRLTESPLPPGWVGWHLVQADLSSARGVSTGVRHRPVRNRAVARIEVEAPVPAIRTQGDLVVHAAVPRIDLPGSLADADWVVTVADADGEVVARWSSDAESPDPNSIWHQVPRPVVGTFTLRVRGPWGRGASRTVTIVEGLAAACSPEWRRFVEGGLQPCTVRLSGAGIDIARPELELLKDKRETRVRAGANRNHRTLVVRPPHMTVAYQASEFGINPTTRPLRLVRERVLEDPGDLVLDVGAAADPKLHLLAPSGVLQTLAPQDGRVGVFRFDLTRIVDTLDGLSQAQLALSDTGALVVAVIRPQRLFSDITVVDGALELTGCDELEGLEAAVYLTRAPWIPPVVLPVRRGRATLPESHRLAGPLRVFVHVDDPWAPEPLPRWPEPRQSLLVQSNGDQLWDRNDLEATALSSYLADTGPFPGEISDFSRLWTILSHLDSLDLGDRAAEVWSAIDGALHAQPRQGLLSLIASDVTKTLVPHLLVRAGLAWANLEEAHDEEVPPWTPRAALPAALLSAADSEWSPDEIEAAISVCGDAVQDLLAGVDPSETSGRFDDSADLFDAHPAIRDAFAREAGLVPKALLDPDTRVLASMELIRERRHLRLKWLVSHAHQVLAEAERIVAMLGDSTAKAAFEARHHPTATGGWRVIPAISMGYALAARHAARGHADATRWLDRQARAWADLAHVAPQLVTIDLIVAELRVSGTMSTGR